MIKHHDQKRLGGETVLSGSLPDHCSSLREVKNGVEEDVEAEAMRAPACWRLPWLAHYLTFSLLSYLVQAHLPRGASGHDAEIFKLMTEGPQ